MVFSGFDGPGGGDGDADCVGGAVRAELCCAVLDRRESHPETDSGRVADLSGRCGHEWKRRGGDAAIVADTGECAMGADFNEGVFQYLRYARSDGQTKLPGLRDP